MRRGLFDYKMADQFNAYPMTPEISQLSDSQYEAHREPLLEAAIEMNLKLSYEARIESHENARTLAFDLAAAGKESCARPQSTPATAS